MPGTGPTSTPLRYAEALHRLLSLADYERMAGLAAPTYKHDLGRMRELAERMGNPQDCAPAVHIAGTKGKGSVAAMVTSVLRAAGLRVVTFTSPHLHSFRERIAVNGAPCTEEQFAHAVERVWPHVEAMAPGESGSDSRNEAGSPIDSSTSLSRHSRENPVGSRKARPTTFEALTAMAFDMACLEKADAQVLEVGLGGRLDSTNVVDAAVSVITSISLDHTAILGSTIAEIAAEKAGIVKGSAPVVVAPQPREAFAVVEAVARVQGAPLVRVGRDVTWEAGEHDLAGQALTVRTPRGAYTFRLPLLGAHQQENAAVAIAAVEALGLGVTPEQVAAGMRDVHWDGRFHVLSTSPYVVVDGAHNAYSMARLCEAVREYLPSKQIVAVFGCSRDKNAQDMVDELAGLASRVVVTTSQHPRAMPTEALVTAFERAGIGCEAAPDVSVALERARGLVGADGVVLVTGSLFIVAEAIEVWRGIPGERYPEFDP